MDAKDKPKQSIKTINISLPAELLTAVDQAAKQFYASRSEYIRHAVIEQLQTDADSHYNRRRTHKNVPRWAIKSSDTEEFELSDDYI